MKQAAKTAPPVREAWSAGVAADVFPAGPLVVSADAEHQVAAFEAETGRRVWRYPFSSSPFALGEGHVLVRAGRGEVHLLELETGRPAGCIPHGPFDSARVSGGVLFAHRRPHYTDEPRVTAVALATGRRLWMRVGRLAQTPSSEPDALAVDSGAVVVGENGEVIALDAATGAERWRRAWPDVRETDDLRPPHLGPIFVDGGRVVVAVERRVACLDLADGRVLWEEDGVVDVVDDGRVYGSLQDRYHVRQVGDGALSRKEAASGAPEALRPLLTRETRVGLVADRHAYLLAGWSAGEALVAVDRERGKYAWHFQPGGGGNSARVVAGGGRIFYANFGRLYALTPP